MAVAATSEVAMRVGRFGGLWWQLVVVGTVLVLAGALTVVGARSQRSLDADHVDCSQAKCIALTFDDGPSPFADGLLKVLSDRGAKATFFLIGNKVAADPAAARRIADAGMEVASHTWEHPNMSTVAAGDIPAQLRKATEAIAAATGRAPTLYRPAEGLVESCRRIELWWPRERAAGQRSGRHSSHPYSAAAGHTITQARAQPAHNRPAQPEPRRAARIGYPPSAGRRHRSGSPPVRRGRCRRSKVAVGRRVVHVEEIGVARPSSNRDSPEL